MFVGVPMQPSMRKKEDEEDLLVDAAKRACCSTKQFNRPSSPAIGY